MGISIAGRVRVVVVVKGVQWMAGINITDRVVVVIMICVWWMEGWW